MKNDSNKDDKDKKKMPLHKKNIVLIGIVVIITICICILLYKWYQDFIRFKKYESRSYEYGYSTLSDIEQSGYAEDIKMDYIKNENIEAKIDSLLMDNDYLELKISFKFFEKIIIDSGDFTYDFAIYDENNNVYGVIHNSFISSNKDYIRYMKNMYKELNIDYNPLDIFSNQLCASSNIQNVSEKNVIISKICMNGFKNFPRSKEMYIRVFNLGFNFRNSEKDSKINLNNNNLEWIFKLSIPDTFYNFNDIKMTTKEDIPEITLNEVLVGNKRTKVVLEYNNYEELVKNNDANIIKEFIYITDEKGNYYYMTNGRESNGIITRYFDINKNMVSNRLFLNIKNNNGTYTTEMVLK